MYKLPEFKSQKELFDFLVKEESTIFAQKKMAMKKADPIFHPSMLLRNSFASKSEDRNEDETQKDVLDVSLVINTTNFIDSHKDLHVPGLWKKSLSENSNGLLLKEHKMTFEDIIASGDDLDVFTRDTTWKSLGYNFEGKTQALLHNARVHKSRNPYMFDQYQKGYVTNHSVGMVYVKLVTCIDDEDYPVQKENWDKYIKECINPEAVAESKYFWAVLEAKYMEGSAVPRGSNSITPTLSVKSEAGGGEIIDKELEVIKQWIFNN